MKTVAIITGASSGMGRCFAETAERAKIAFDEVWVIARREDRLRELKLAFPTRVIALDLAEQESLNKFAALLEAEQPDVKLLVNASGFGKFLATMDVPLESNLGMVDLNCKALMAMCQLTIPYMSAGSRIINIASVAAYQPVPYINVYAASKAFVLHYSRGLNRELKKRGITVTAVCPFWTKTEFFDRAVAADRETVVKKYAVMYRAEDVVARAWRDALRGKDMSKFGFIARAQGLLAKILPHKLVMWVWTNDQKLD